MYMEKLSQVELLQLNEAFSDYLKGALKLAGKGAVAATKGIVKTVTPTGYGMLKTAGDAAGKAIAGAALENPVNVLRAMLSSSEGRKTIQSGKIGKESKLDGGYREIELEGNWISDPRQSPVPFKTKVIMVKDNSNQWKLAGNFDKDTGEFIFDTSSKKNKAGVVPTLTTKGQKSTSSKTPAKPQSTSGKAQLPRSKTSATSKTPAKPQTSQSKSTTTPAKSKVSPKTQTTGKAPTTPKTTTTRSTSSKAQTTPANKPKAQQTTNPKFYKALRDWKVKNIGPQAERVGIDYNNLKEFLKSLNVQDADRVLKTAGIKERGTRSVSNKELANIEATLKSRDVVSESYNSALSQRDLINLLLF